MENLFSERQQFRQWWLRLMLIAVNAYLIYGMINQVFNSEVFGNKPVSNTGIIIITALIFLLSFSILFARLETEIKPDGIYYRFLPIHFKSNRILWENISESYVRKYNPIADYGGWGFRLGLFGNGKALNTSGDQGLQIVYNNGKRLLLGTQKPEEIKTVLKNLGKLSEVV
jgi:hypothetical protein